MLGMPGFFFRLNKILIMIEFIFGLTSVIVFAILYIMMYGKLATIAKLIAEQNEFLKKIIQKDSSSTSDNQEFERLFKRKDSDS